MGRLRLILAVAGVGMALAPAAAHAEHPALFEIYEPTAVKGSAGTAADQHLDIGPFEIKCARATATGQGDYERIYADLHLSDCEAVGKLGEQPLTSKAVIQGSESKNAVIFNEVPGNTGGPGGVAQLGPFRVRLSSIKCTIDVSPALPVFFGESIYSNEETATRNLRHFPTGFQQRLETTTSVGGLEATYGGSCADFSPSSGGAYVGNMMFESTTEDIGWEPAGE
jgi:hypothetical protein